MSIITIRNLEIIDVYPNMYVWQVRSKTVAQCVEFYYTYKKQMKVARNGSLIYGPSDPEENILVVKTFFPYCLHKYLLKVLGLSKKGLKG